MSQPFAKARVMSSASLPKGIFARSRVYLFAGVPVIALLFAGGAKWLRLPGSDPRMVTPAFRELETRLDRTLYAPTGVPFGTALHPDGGPTTGAHRVMQAYVTRNSDMGFILAQEPRNKERDAYHHRLFVRNAERKVDLNGKQGYIITGLTGERRLFWHEEDASIIVSSASLPDETLVAVALKVERWPAR